MSVDNSQGKVLGHAEEYGRTEDGLVVVHQAIAYIHQSFAMGKAHLHTNDHHWYQIPIDGSEHLGFDCWVVMASVLAD